MKKKHWEWLIRDQLKVQEKNIMNELLVKRNRLHIKLGLMKQYARAMDKQEHCFDYIYTFQGNKASTFKRFQIRKFIKILNIKFL